MFVGLSDYLHLTIGCIGLIQLLQIFVSLVLHICKSVYRRTTFNPIHPVAPVRAQRIPISLWDFIWRY